MAAATELEARLHENALAALQDVKQSIAGGLDPYKLPALGPRRDDVITGVNSPITPILDAATQQALFTRLLVLELSSKNLAGVWPRMRDGKPVPLSEGQENQELLDKVASAVATVNGRVQDILNLLTDQGFVLEDVGPENYQTDLPVSPEVEEKVRSIFDLLRSVGPETVKGLPPVADVFATGEAAVPTYQAVWGLLSAIHSARQDGVWNDHNGATNPMHVTTTRKGSGAVYVSVRDQGGTVNPAAEILPALWEKVRAMDDLTSDTLLVCLAHWVAKSEGPNSPVWISADAVLTARGVRPKRYETEGKRWAHGHRTEDRMAVGQALAQLDALWLQLVDVEVTRGKRSPRRLNIESKAMAMLDKVTQQGMDGDTIFLAARVMPGSWAAAYREAEIWQTGLLAQKALAYDPYREQPEKRLAKFLAFQVRIDAHNGRDSLDRKVSTLLDSAGLVPDADHPDRMRRRLEKALNRLRDDKIIDEWSDANNRALPSKRWLETWLGWVIRITPRAIERETYTRFQWRPRRTLAASD